MTLPQLPIPKIEIPFDIPLLMHSPLVHFVIAIPILVFLLEILNLFMKKRAIGGVSFFLLTLGVLISIGAYFTGITDGNEAYAALDTADIAVKEALGEHKLLGAYIVLGMALVLMLKTFAMTGLKFFKALYILLFMVLLVLLFEQGEEGGELVFEHGLNVKKVQTLDDTLFDTNEELEELQESLKKVNSELQSYKEKAKEATKAVTPEVETQTDVSKEVTVPTSSEASTVIQNVDTSVESGVTP